MRIDPKQVPVQGLTSIDTRTTIPGEGRGESAASAAPPKGADSSLWDMLTPEEREYFVRQAELGPLTYGPRSAASPAAPTGRRLNRLG